MRFIGALLAFLLAASPAAAERVIAALATDVIGVSSAFQGARLALFGVIEADAGTGIRQGAYDAVVVVRGPARVQIVRRKERVGIAWVNMRSRTYVASPTYYATLSTRPLADATAERTRSEAGIGLAALQLIQPWSPINPADDGVFRDAFVQNRVDEGLFVEADGPDAVRFLAPNVFRATIPLPSNAPIGFYSVEVLVLSDGFVVGRETTTFSLEKIGFEAVVYQASRESPFLYGLATVALALATGWGAGVLFRRG